MKLKLMDSFLTAACAAVMFGASAHAAKSWSDEEKVTYSMSCRQGVIDNALFAETKKRGMSLKDVSEEQKRIFGGKMDELGLLDMCTCLMTEVEKRYSMIDLVTMTAEDRTKMNQELMGRGSVCSNKFISHPQAASSNPKQ